VGRVVAAIVTAATRAVGVADGVGVARVMTCPQPPSSNRQRHAKDKVRSGPGRLK